MKKYLLYILVALAIAITSKAQQTNTFAPQKNNALKINLLSPAYGNLSLSYQRLLNPFKSINVVLGYIDFDDYTRFNTTDKFRLQGASIIIEYRTNLTGYGLNGTYFSPFTRYINYQTTDSKILSTTTTELTGNLQSAGIGFIVGKQYIIKNKVALDLFAGPSYQILLANTRPGHTQNDFLPSISDRYLAGYGIRAGITMGIIY